MSEVTTRQVFIDWVRFIAIVLMVFYHFCFDLWHFELYDTDLNSSVGWRSLRYVIMSLFISCVGASLVFAHPERIRFRRFFRRMLWLGLASIAVSVGSYTQFPHSWIYFGILHFILWASLCCILLRHYPNIALLLAVVILVAYNAGLLTTNPLFTWLQPLLHLPLRTEDLVPFFPWFGVALFGVYVAKQLQLPFVQVEAPVWVTFVSRNALIIYLVHQPLLFALFIIVTSA